jgi:MFS family permease
MWKLWELVVIRFVQGVGLSGEVPIAVGIVAVAGRLAALLGEGPETSERLLEEISP